MRKRRYLTWLGSALFTTGAVVLGVYLWNQHIAREAQSRAKEWLNETRKAQADSQVSATPHALSPRSAVATRWPRSTYRVSECR